MSSPAIVHPDAGDILLHGRSIVGLKANRIAAAGIRRTFQTSLLCKGMTVLENVMAGLHVKLHAGALAAAFGLRSVWRDEQDAAEAAHAALAYVGAGALAERDGGQLSFGQQRVVEIARALISRAARAVAGRTRGRARARIGSPIWTRCCGASAMSAVSPSS